MEIYRTLFPDVQVTVHSPMHVRHFSLFLTLIIDLICDIISYTCSIFQSSILFNFWRKMIFSFCLISSIIMDNSSGKKLSWGVSDVQS